MYELIAGLYEGLLYDVDYYVIFETLYETGSYGSLASFAAVPAMALFTVFYFLWPYPYAKSWHWVACLGISLLITMIGSYVWVYNELFYSYNNELIALLNDPETGYDYYASSLPWNYSFINGAIGALVAFIFSLGIKRFSKIQMHLPF